MTRIHAVIFDLDNVLYDERDYLRAVYHNIAAFLSRHYSIDKQEIYHRLTKECKLKTTMYSYLFNDLLDSLGIDQMVLPNLLRIYADTKTRLRLRTSAEMMLSSLKKRNVKLGLLTNGIAEAQANKVKLLGIEEYFDAIVYASQLGEAKPNQGVYTVILRELDTEPRYTLCIGDNPYTDFLGAKKLGMPTVRLLMGEFRNLRLAEEYEADKTVRTLKELYIYLKSYDRSNQIKIGNRKLSGVRKLETSTLNAYSSEF